MEKKKRTISCYAGNCSVKKYTGSEVAMHRFPADIERCKEWVKRAGNPKLHSRAIDKLWNSAYLCQHHFASNQYISFHPRRLIPGALPSIFPSDDSNSNHPSSSAGISSPCSISAISESSTSNSFLIISTADANQYLPSPTVGTSSSCPSAVPVPSSSHSFPILLAENYLSLATPLPPSPASFENPSPENEILIQSVQTCSFSPSAPGPSSSTAATPSSNASGKGDTRRALKRRAEPSVLKIAGLRRCDLTPRKMFLYSKYRMMCRRNSYLRRKSLANDLINKLDFNMRLLLQSQLQNFQRKPKGRRWSLKEKLFFISLYKRSPLTYTYMRSKFALPTRQTLLSVLNAGINPGVIKHLSLCASKMSDHDKYCVLLFDEMSIKPCLLYNSRSDCIEGFEDHGSKGRSDGIAREALVFMVRGLQQKWKQPVAFYFSQRSTPGLILADLIREVLDALQSTGLKIVATVCDMGSNNIQALKTLGYSINNPFFCFKGQEIFTLHDPPHLLKCTRNMFMKYPVKGNIMVGGKMFTGIGRWSHIQEVFNFSKDKEKEMIPNHVVRSKLTEKHLSPTWKQKMNVRMAAEVFSEEVIKTMEWLRILGIQPFETCVTTTFLSFIRDLFASFNGGEIEGGSQRSLQSYITRNSPHTGFWASALKEIQEWVFIKDEVSGRIMRPKSQNGWVITIKAIKLLWQKLREAGFNLLEPRRLNQDPLENFFGSIRLHCGANRNPTVQQFASAIKTSIIKNISSQLSRRMNCDPDGDDFIAELEEFIQLIPSVQEDASDAQDTSADVLVSEMSAVDEEAAPEVSVESFMMDISLAKSCSRILKALLKNNRCSTCVSLLTVNNSVLSDSVLSTNEALLVDDRIGFPAERFTQSVQLAIRHLQRYIEENKIVKGIGSGRKTAILHYFSWLHCEVHDLKEGTAKLLVRYALDCYCRNTTRGIM